jgi:hypothetical protein
MLVGPVEPEAREEDLIREVRIERRRDVGDRGKVLVDELGDPRGVIDRATTGAACDVEGALREAEVLLDVDQQQMDARLVGGGGLELVLGTPPCRGAGELRRIRPEAPVGCVQRVEETRDG